MNAAAAIALWYTLHLWICLLALAHALPEFSDATHVTHPQPGEVLGVLGARLPWRLGTSVGWFLLQGFTVALAVFWLLGDLLAFALARFGIADLHASTGAAWCWALRRTLRAHTFWLSVALIAALAIADRMAVPAYLVSLTVVAAVLLFLATPVMVLNRAEPSDHATLPIASAPARSPWQAASIYYFGAAILLGVGYAARSILDEWGLLGWLLSCFEATAESWAFLCLVSAMVHGIGWGSLQAELSRRLRTRFLALAVLLDLRVLMVCLWVAPSLLLAVFVAIHVLPTHEATLRAIGVAPSPVYLLAASMLHYTVSYWWMLVLPMAVPYLIACRRSLTMFDRAEAVRFRPG